MYCSKCGQELNKRDTFCSACGEKIDNVPNESKENKKNSGWRGCKQIYIRYDYG